MSCCSNRTTCQCAAYLGVFDPCGDITLPITADSTGDYTMKVDYLGNIVQITAAQVFDEDVVFPASGLNEHFTFIAQVYDEAGDVVRVNGKAWIKFATRKTYELA